MTVLEEKFRFIRDDVFLIARVNAETGRQQLVMRKVRIDPDTKEERIEFEDAIDCIHTAVMDIPMQKFTDLKNDVDAQEDFYKKTLNIRSSIALQVINLEPEEKFKAFKSWVAGIAEAGSEAFHIQANIEKEGNLLAPISGRLLGFMAKVDSDLIPQLLLKIEKNCIFEGEMHEASLIANLIPIIKILISRFFGSTPKERHRLSNKEKEYVNQIMGLNPPMKIFFQRPEYLLPVMKTNYVYILNYLKEI
ncbi:MAG: hypothetical protein GY870_18880, partial [archaeon]|nr:hypothetical protein [archaeon]